MRLDTWPAVDLIPEADRCVDCSGRGCGNCGNSGQESEAVKHGMRRKHSAEDMPQSDYDTFNGWNSPEEEDESLIGISEDDYFSPEERCCHDWNEDDYCNLCGADGRA